MRPAELALLQGQMVVGREPVAHDDSAEGLPQQLMEQRLGLAETQREGATQHTHQRTEPWPVAARFHIRRQRGAGAGGTAGTDQPVFDHLLAQRLWILTLQQRAAAAAGLGVVLHHLTHPSVLLPQAGQLARQVGELGAQILVLLLLGADEISGA